MVDNTSVQGEGGGAALVPPWKIPQSAGYVLPTHRRCSIFHTPPVADPDSGVAAHASIEPTLTVVCAVHRIKQKCWFSISLKRPPATHVVGTAGELLPVGGIASLM